MKTLKQAMENLKTEYLSELHIHDSLHDCISDTLTAYEMSEYDEAEKKACDWAYNDWEGFWYTACGMSWVFNDEPDDPREQQCNFCPKCGKFIKVTGRGDSNANH